MLEARNCHENLLNDSLATITVCVTWYRTCVIRRLLIVSDLPTNCQLFLQGLMGLKNRLYATPSPTTNDCHSYFIVWMSIVWMYSFCNRALRLPYISKPTVCIMYGVSMWILIRMRVMLTRDIVSRTHTAGPRTSWTRNDFRTNSDLYRPAFFASPADIRAIFVSWASVKQCKCHRISLHSLDGFYL